VRAFLQAESEVAAINMVYVAAAACKRTMTSSSSPGISLMQEGISFLAGAELPVNSLLVRPQIVAIAFALGLVVTLVAALLPAIRATRVEQHPVVRHGTRRTETALHLQELATGRQLDRVSVRTHDDGDVDPAGAVEGYRF
jgi:hypothetical protein